MYFDTCEDILRESIAGDVIPSAAFAIGQGREVLRSGVMGIGHGSRNRRRRTGTRCMIRHHCPSWCPRPW